MDVPENLIVCGTRRNCDVINELETTWSNLYAVLARSIINTEHRVWDVIKSEDGILHNDQTLELPSPLTSSFLC